MHRGGCLTGGRWLPARLHRGNGWRGAPLAAGLVAAALLGAVPVRAGADVPADPQLDDLFELSVGELLNVPVVTASKVEEPLWRSPNVVTVISGETMRRYGHRTLAEALRTVVGLIPGFDGWRDLVGLRGEFGQGTFNSRVLWLLDGHRVNDAFFQGAYPGDLFPVDLALVDHVEVVRGPGSALYGSNAFFGVVNVVTRTPRQAAGATLSIASGGYLSVPAAQTPQVSASQLEPISDRRWSASLGTTLAGADVLLAVSSHHDDGHPIWIPYFNATGAGAVADRKDDVDADKVLLDVRQGRWRLLAGHARNENGNPDANYGAVPDSPLNRTSSDIWFAEGQHAWAPSPALTLSSRLYWDRNVFVRDWHYDGVWPLDTKDVRSSGFGLEERLDWRSGPNRLLVGAELQLLRTTMREYYPSEPDAVSGLPFSNDYARDFLTYAVYASDEVELSDRWLLTGGARVEGNDVDGAVATGRAAVVFRPWGSTVLKLQAGQGFKNTAENFYSYHSSELDAFQFDIVRLEREQVTSLELVWTQLVEPASLTLVLFDNRVRRLITYDGATDSYFNGPGLDAQGVEAELALNLAGRVSAYGNWSWVRSTNRDGSTVYNVPDWSLKAGAVVRLLSGDWLAAAAEAQLYGPADYVDFPAERPGVELHQGTYGLVNLNLTGRVAPFKLAWSVGVKNLLNQSFGYAVANGTRQPFPGAGRSWQASFELRL